MSTRTNNENTPADMLAELARRVDGGIEVLLVWHRGDGLLKVVIDDLRTGDAFELIARDGKQGLDAFHHPFAYAAPAVSPITARPGAGMSRYARARGAGFLSELGPNEAPVTMTLGSTMGFLRKNGPREEELAALADGSLAPERRAALEVRVAASPELAERLAEQERRSRSRGALRRRSRRRRRCERASTHNDVRAAAAPRRLVLSAPPRLAGGRRHRLAVFGSGTSAERFQPPSGRPTCARCQGRGDAHQDVLGLADRARRHRASPPRQRALLRGVAAKPAGVLVPIGTFNEGRKVTLWAGVSPTDFSTLTVTREQADGDQASSGEKVLVGRSTPAADEVQAEPPSIRRTTCWRAR